MGPPLPDWNESSSSLPMLDPLAPVSGLLPDPGPENVPVDLPPADAMPSLPPLQGPSDGEGAPELPEVPGLVLPKTPPPAAPGTGTPAPVDPLKQLQTAVHWHASPREARAEAQKEGRPMMLVIAGFGWSPACKSLDATLLSHPGFQEFAKKNLVLSFLNVPTQAKFSSGGDSDLEQQKLDTIKAYRAFLKVRSLPTIILFDSEGHEVDRMVGYNFNKGLVVNSFRKASERIETVVKTTVSAREAKERRHKLLEETQKYRTWTSRAGSTYFAKSVSAATYPAPTDDKPDATEPAVLMMDENSKRRIIPLRLLAISDAEIVRRTHFKTPPPDKDADFPTRTPYTDNEKDWTPRVPAVAQPQQSVENVLSSPPPPVRPPSE